MLAKMARGSGKRSRLHRGFSKGPSSVPSLRQSLRRWLGVLGLCRQQLGRAIAWLRCALCRVSNVKAAHVQHLPPISLQAIDGRHAASDSRKPASESAFGGLMMPVERRERTGGLAQPVLHGNSCLPSLGGLSLFRVLWVEGGARRPLSLSQT